MAMGYSESFCSIFRIKSKQAVFCKMQSFIVTVQNLATHHEIQPSCAGFAAASEHSPCAPY